MMKRSLSVMAFGLLASLVLTAPSEASTTFTYSISPTSPQTINATGFAYGTASMGSGSTTFTGVSGTYSATVPPDANIQVATFTQTATGSGPTAGGFGGASYSPSSTVSQTLSLTYLGITKTFTITENMGSAVVYAGNALASPQVTFTSPISIGDEKFTITGYQVNYPAHGTPSVSVQIAATAVPEPTSMALLGLGMTSFLAFRRFFKRTPVA
jgi:hypothetical protein